MKTNNFQFFQSGNLFPAPIENLQNIPKGKKIFMCTPVPTPQFKKQIGKDRKCKT
jgi:hypothetical protein